METRDRCALDCDDDVVLDDKQFKKGLADMCAADDVNSPNIQTEIAIGPGVTRQAVRKFCKGFSIR